MPSIQKGLFRGRIYPQINIYAIGTIGAASASKAPAAWSLDEVSAMTPSIWPRLVVR